MQRVAASLLILCGLAGAVAADEYFIPGRSYVPGFNQLPPLNSPHDLYNLQADIIQSQIYAKQRQQAIERTELSRFIQHDFSNDPIFTPDY